MFEFNVLLEGVFSHFFITKLTFDVFLCWEVISCFVCIAVTVSHFVAYVAAILLFTHVSSLVDLEFFLDFCFVWTNRARISYTRVDRFFMPLQTSRRMEFLSADAACMNFWPCQTTMILVGVNSKRIWEIELCIAQFTYEGPFFSMGFLVAFEASPLKKIWDCKFHTGK